MMNADAASRTPRMCSLLRCPTARATFMVAYEKGTGGPECRTIYRHEAMRDKLRPGKSLRAWRHSFRSRSSCGLADKIMGNSIGVEPREELSTMLMEFRAGDTRSVT